VIDDGRYKSGGTPAGKWGCGFSAIVVVPLLCMAILLGASSNCVPDTACDHDGVWKLQLAALVVAAIVGIGSRAFIDRWIGRRQGGNWLKKDL
jgi:hypothetical protein